MTSERIKAIQETTAYPESVSVKQALLQVWNECEQEKQGWVKIDEDYKMLPLRSVVGLRASGEALLTTSLHLTDQTYQFVYYIELPQKPEV